MFEKGNFAGLEEIKKNDRLYNKIAPIGVNDIMMAVQYKYVPRPPLCVPIISFDGISDATIDAGNMEHWAQYTTGAFCNVPVDGDHYFVSTRYHEVGLSYAPPCTLTFDHVIQGARQWGYSRDDLKGLLVREGLQILARYTSRMLAE